MILKRIPQENVAILGSNGMRPPKSRFALLVLVRYMAIIPGRAGHSEYRVRGTKPSNDLFLSRPSSEHTLTAKA